MRFHHMCLITANLEQSIAFWRDIMGFTLKVKAEIPDGDSPESLAARIHSLEHEHFPMQIARWIETKLSLNP